MKKWFMAALIPMLFVCITTAAEKDDALWKDIEPSRPFKNVWSAIIEDDDGPHKIIRGWIEGKYTLSSRRVSDIHRETLGKAALDRRFSAGKSIQFQKLMFLESADHRLYAVETESGVIKWVTYFPRKIQFDPCFGDKYIYVLSDEILFAVNREYGLLAWRMPLRFPASTSPVLGKTGTLYLGSWGNRLVAIDTLSRAVQWRERVYGNCVAAPVYEKGLIYVPSDNGSIYTYKSNGDRTFSFKTNGPIRRSPKIREGIMIFGSYDNSLYCINRYNGEKIWESRIGRPLISEPEIIGKYVYVKPSGKGITAISIETGKQVWQIPYTDEIVGFSRKTVYLFTGDHEEDRFVLGIESDTGRIMWVFDPALNIKKDFDRPLKNVQEVNKIFFVNEWPGRIFMLAEKGFYEQIAEKQAGKVKDKAADDAEKDASDDGTEEDADGESIDDLIDIDI